MFSDPQINFYVVDVEASARFYSELFGFSETFRTPDKGAPIHVELSLGPLKLGLVTFESARRLHGLEVGSGPPRAELVLWTDDVDEAHAAATAKGARTLSPPHDFLAALRAAWVTDPDGNPVQIVARRVAASA